MGNIISKVKNRLNKGSKKNDFNYKVIMLGLDGVGKTSLFYKLQNLTSKKKSKHSTSVFKQNLENIAPTVGFNCDTVHYKTKKLNVWDIGGQQKIKVLWRHYFPGATDLIYVIDSSNHERMNETKVNFYELISDKELEKIRIVILCNKQDIPGSLTPEAMIEYLELNKNLDSTKQEWCCFGTDALSLDEKPNSSNQLEKDGLIECLDWIVAK